MADFPSVFRIQHVDSGAFMTMSDTTGNPIVGGPTSSASDNKSHFQLAGVAAGGYKLKNVGFGKEAHFDAAKSGMLFGTATGAQFYFRKESNGQFVIHVNRSPNNYVVDLEQSNLLGGSYGIRLVPEKSAKSPRWTLGDAKCEDPKPDPKPDPTDNCGCKPGDGTGVKPDPKPEPEPEPKPDPTDNCGGGTKPGDGSGPVCFPFASGIYTIRNVKTGNVVDLDSGTDGEGVKIFGHTGNNGANQRWEIMPSGNGSNMTIRSVATNEYAAYPKYEQSQTLISSFRAAEYIITPADKGFYIAPVELPTHVVDLTKGLDEEENPICLWIKHTEDHQKWYFERAM